MTDLVYASRGESLYSHLGDQGRNRGVALTLAEQNHTRWVLLAPFRLVRLRPRFRLSLKALGVAHGLGDGRLQYSISGYILLILCGK
jgi:hypothetical protein